METCWIWSHGVAPKDDVAGKYVIAFLCKEHNLLLLCFLAELLQRAAAGREEPSRLGESRVPMAGW